MTVLSAPQTQTPFSSVRAVADPLADCMARAARMLGARVSAQSLAAGLPLIDGKLAPSLVGRAAERCGLTAEVRSCALEDLAALGLPAVLLLEGGDACVLLERVGEEVRIVAA